MTKYKRVELGDGAVTINAQVDVEFENLSYLDSCCRIRGVSRTRLIRRLLDYILRDNLIEALLDDNGKWVDEKQRTRKPYAVKYTAPVREASPEATAAETPSSPPSAAASIPQCSASGDARLARETT